MERTIVAEDTKVILDQIDKILNIYNKMLGAMIPGKVVVSGNIDIEDLKNQHPGVLIKKL